MMGLVMVTVAVMAALMGILLVMFVGGDRDRDDDGDDAAVTLFVNMMPMNTGTPYCPHYDLHMLTSN